MDTVKKLLMQQLIKLLAPDSPAYGNGSNLPFIKQESLPEIIGQLQVGDIIFTKTNNSLYQLGRKFLQTTYDHVAVVINKKEVIHISPPIISKIEIQKIVQKSRQPFIFRVNWSQEHGQENKQMFLSILQNYLGEKYNEYAIPDMFKNQFIDRTKKILLRQLSLENSSQKNHIEFNLQILKYSRICSESIIYALCRAKKSIASEIQAFVNTQTNYQAKGYIMPDQFIHYLQKMKIQQVYKGTLTQKNQTDKTMINHIEGYYQSLNDNLILPVSEQIKKYFELINLSMSTNPLQISKYLALLLQAKSLLNKTVAIQNPLTFILTMLSIINKLSQFNKKGDQQMRKKQLFLNTILNVIQLLIVYQRKAQQPSNILIKPKL